jgi:rhodanese-related sulfurtransferase
MKKTVLAVFLVMIAYTFVLAAGAREITSVDAKALLEKNKNVFLLDVRTPQEFQQASLKGAVLIPINELERRIKEIPRNRPILIYCAVGARSRPVADFLVQQGYKEIYHMADGIVGWYRNGFPIVKLRER